MAELLGPAMAGTVGIAYEATPAYAVPWPIPDPVAPEPGDPDVEYNPPASMPAPRVQVMLMRYDKTPIGEIVTADVADWTEELDLLIPRVAGVSASSWDPVWSMAGELMGVDTDGKLVYSWDPKGYYIQLFVDGDAEPPFFFRQPVDIGGGQVSMPAVGVEAVANERILGRPVQPDLLGGRGSFEQYGSIGEMVADGWQFDDGVSASLVADGVSGSVALELTGPGWVRSPRVTVRGGGSISKVISGGLFGRWSGSEEALELADVVARTRVVRRSNGAEDLEYRNANVARRPMGQTGWTDDPIDMAGRTQPLAVVHDAGVDLRSHAGVTSRFDFVTLREGTSTGFPPGVVRTYAQHVVRVFRDLHSRSLGGSPTGLVLRDRTEVGSWPTQARRWAHSRRLPVREILTELLDAEGGPECRVTAGWFLDIHDRLGQVRDDIQLSNLDILGPGWAVDPGAQVDVYAGDTGRGSGTNTIAAVVEQPYASSDTRWRVFAAAQAPADLSIDACEAWTRRQAAVAARRQVTAEVAVRWELGRRIATGDTLRVFQSDGLHGDSRMHRVVARRFDPRRLVVVLTLGAAGDG